MFRTKKTVKYLCRNRHPRQNGPQRIRKDHPQPPSPPRISQQPGLISHRPTQLFSSILPTGAFICCPEWTLLCCSIPISLMAA
ncbi:hypothetical protein GDO81_018431 [Engystomops pustulosus]|uniref:Uncharacterized protein n=1 Tax=Engystomops pustulosus TaxID=76066 RepID=A0AAV6ZYB1_ENGPU|nr:hypothetical protein GDO81_018431 [Engystomops pustulosus]